jgi:ribosomal protein S18 acetylase RimI-like enzyme
MDESLIADVLPYLQRDLLRNIVPLKMLQAFPDAITCRYVEAGGEAGALLNFSPQLFPYDAQTYPDAQRIVVLATDGPAASEALLDLLPAGERLLLKLNSPHDRAAVEGRWEARRVRGFQSYTSPPGHPWPPVPEVRVSERLDPACLALLLEQGQDRAEVEGHFAAGTALLCARELPPRQKGEGKRQKAAPAFTVEPAPTAQGVSPVALCIAYRNYGPVWEIGGVYTVPEARRGGHARLAVATALHALAERGLAPRYQVNEANAASIGLAESLGLARFLTIEHFLVQSRRSSR